jgi:5-methyltetrahydrofolate corrinoid/iron sulfur protein methyltransferase
MIPVGERINGSFADVRAAILAKERKLIQDLAVIQKGAGAHYLDCNVGPAVYDEVGAMRWLIETVQDATDAPLSLDSRKLNVIKAGLSAMDTVNGCIINSCTGDERQLDVYIPLAIKHSASLVARTINKDGMPRNADERVEIAATIITRAMDYGLEPERLFIDPIVTPVNLFVEQDRPRYVLSAISQIRQMTDPPIHVICGLSNISRGARDRPLFNRTFLAMAVAAGLDAAIVDVLDSDLMDTWAAAEVLIKRRAQSSDSRQQAALMYR